MTDGPPDNAAVISLVVGRLGVGAVCADDDDGRCPRRASGHAGIDVDEAGRIESP